MPRPRRIFVPESIMFRFKWIIYTDALIQFLRVLLQYATWPASLSVPFECFLKHTTEPTANSNKKPSELQATMASFLPPPSTFLLSL